MESNKGGFNSIDAYIASFPESTQIILEELRATIKAAAPGAKEKISYQMPTFDLKGNLVHFAAYKNHIGFYPTASGIEAFAQELSIFNGAKGSVQFPIDQPLPLELVRRIVKYRVAENLKRAESKSSKKKSDNGFLSLLSAPARRALESKGISTLEQLSGFSESELLELHGMGPSSIPKLRSALEAQGLSFRSQ